MTAEAGNDADYCYRHPGRQSWILCQRCGRTICPECQIQAPVGVQCPECVAEANGGRAPRWTPTVIPGGKPARSRGAASRNGGGTLAAYFAGTRGPHLSWIIVGASLLLWFVGFFTASLPFTWLAAVYGQPPWQLWRFATSFLGNPSLADGGRILLFLLNMGLFAWFGPMIERMIGRSQFAFVFLISSTAGAAVGVLAGAFGYGLSAGLFGVFMYYGITVTRQGGNALLLWGLMAFNVIYTAVAALNGLPQLIGGMIGGAALYFLTERNERTSSRRPLYLQAIAGVAVLIVLATLRTLTAGG